MVLLLGLFYCETKKDKKTFLSGVLQLWMVYPTAACWWQT